MNLLRYTINETLDTYSRHFRSYFRFSFWVSVLSSLVILLLAAFTCYGINEVYQVEYFNSTNPLTDMISSGYFISKFQELGVLMSIVFYGVYAAYLHQKMELAEPGRPTIAEFLNKGKPLVWKTFLLSMLFLVVVYFISYKELFKVESREEGILGLLDKFGGSGSRSNIFFKWLNNIIFLLKSYLPYALAFIIVIAAVKEDAGFKTIKLFKKEMLAVLFFAFILKAIMDNLISFVDYYLVELLNVLFPDGFIVGIFRFFVTLFIGVYFYLAFACILIFPAKYRVLQMEGVSTDGDPNRESDLQV